jgi:hypothetical protein
MYLSTVFMLLSIECQGIKKRKYCNTIRNIKIKYRNFDTISFKHGTRNKWKVLKMILNLLEGLTGKYLIGAIPQGFSSTRYILQGGIRWYANCGFWFRSSVSFGQERSPKSAPTTCTNRSGQTKSMT